jgi:hypothetical protein
VEKPKSQNTQQANDNSHTQTPLVMPNPMNGEGVRLPFPSSVDYLNGINILDGEGMGAPPSGGGGSGNRGEAMYIAYNSDSLEAQCTTCNGEKFLTFLDQSSLVNTSSECPVCLGKGTLGSLREPDESEMDEIAKLFSRISFTTRTPIVLETGRRVAVVLKHLYQSRGYSEKTSEKDTTYFHLAAISTGDARDKLDLSRLYSISVLGRSNLSTTQSEKTGDITLSVRGITSALEVLRIVAVTQRPNTFIERIGRFVFRSRFKSRVIGSHAQFGRERDPREQYVKPHKKRGRDTEH